MASSNIEEPFQFNFPADSFHSGSISFGRFETECLSWERRSSFSHNKYLEEVEKYSKPGSVTEKKAYFEAHFRKKALLRQSLSENQNGTHHQVGENGNLHNMGYFDNINEDIHFTNFEVNPGDWEYDGEFEATKCERESTGALRSESQITNDVSSIDAFGIVIEHVRSEKAHEIDFEVLPKIDDEPQNEVDVHDEIDFEALPKTDDEPQMVMDLHDEIVQANVTSSVIGSSSTSHTAARDDSVSSGQHTPSSKERIAQETKPTNSMSKSLAKVPQVQGITSSKASKRTEVKLSGRVNDGSLRPNTDKKSPQGAASSTRLMGRLQRPEGLGSKAKVKLEEKSMQKTVGTKKVAGYQSSGSDKTIPKAHQTANKSKHNISLTTEAVRQSALAFNFKSDQRAEKRREYFMKLEEKMHVKKAPVYQIQAKTQEKTDVETKQLGRSRNFNAKPMPSFYLESVLGSNKDKAISSRHKSMRSSNMGHGCAEHSAYSKSGNEATLSASEPVTKADLQETLHSNKSSIPFNTSKNCLASVSERNHFTESGTNNDVTGNLVREKKESHPQRPRMSTGNKVVKGQAIEGKQKVGARRNISDLRSKDMKGVCIASCLQMSHLVVGVAS